MCVLAEQSEDNIWKKKRLDCSIRLAWKDLWKDVYHVSTDHECSKARAMSIQNKHRSEEVKFGFVIHVVLLNALQEHDPARAA